MVAGEAAAGWAGAAAAVGVIEASELAECSAMARMVVWQVEHWVVARGTAAVDASADMRDVM